MGPVSVSVNFRGLFNGLNWGSTGTRDQSSRRLNYLGKISSIQGYCTARDNQCDELRSRSPAATSCHCSAKVHGPGHVFMWMSKVPLKLAVNTANRNSWVCLSCCLRGDVGCEKLLVLLRFVVVLRTRAHVVRI